MPAFAIKRTKKGLPAIWEKGGSGSAVIVASSQGRPLAPVFLAPRTARACGEHALFVINPGMVVVTAEHVGGEASVRAYRLSGEVVVQEGQEVAAAEEIGVEGLDVAEAAAVEKSRCLRCREAHFFRQSPKKGTIVRI